nr:hypothetical protein [bacterium]
MDSGGVIHSLEMKNTGYPQTLSAKPKNMWKAAGGAAAFTGAKIGGFITHFGFKQGRLPGHDVNIKKPRLAARHPIRRALSFTD